MRKPTAMTMINAAAAVTVLMCLAGSWHGARAEDAPSGDAVEGKRLFLADGCFTCHGRSGQGGNMNTPTPVLARTEMPFDGFKGQLRQPVNEMPAYSEAVMSDKQIADIYAFVKSLPGRRPAKDFPLLND
jgi:mono/diheme cytochrome c family protein